MLSPVQLEVRGRGLRTFDPNDRLLISKRGDRPPRLIVAADVRPGDYAGVQYGAKWPGHGPPLPDPDRRPLTGSEKPIRYPTEMTDDLAFLLGAYLAEGHTTRSNWSVILTNSVVEVLERAQRCWWEIFGLRSRITRQPGRCTGVVVSSKRLVEYMDRLECGSRASNKQVPRVIQCGTKAHVLTFLQGAALDAYTTQVTSAKWAICLESQLAILQLQDVVTQLGIVNAQISKWNAHMRKTYYELYAAGRQGQRLCEFVPFLEPDKQAAAERFLARRFSSSWTDVMPGITGPELYGLIPVGRSGRGGRGTGRQRFRHLCDPRTRHITRVSVKRAAEAGAELPVWLEKLVEQRIVFAPVLGQQRPNLSSSSTRCPRNHENS